MTVKQVDIPMNNTINLKCPNCGEDLYLEKVEQKIDGEYFDVWKCENCLHITVLDQRYDVEESNLVEVTTNE